MVSCHKKHQTPRTPIRSSQYNLKNLFQKARHVIHYFPPHHCRSETTYSPATLALSILATTEGISLFSLASPSTAFLNPLSTPSCLSSAWISSFTLDAGSRFPARSSVACSSSSSRLSASVSVRSCSAATFAGTERFSAATCSRRVSSCVTSSASLRRLAVSNGS